jgi:hypothetical protein
MYTVVLYALNVWAVGVWVASSPVAAWLAAVLAVGTLVAGLCDVVENLLLLRLLRRAPSKDSVPRLVATLARTKFVLIGLAVLSTVVATLRWGLWWLSSR